MTTGNDIPILSRPAFFPGQQLRAADLDAVTGYHRELSWLHNRSLHNWGIATGYTVTGAAGDGAVLVGPGYALDCQGRELIVTQPRQLTVPAVAGDAEGQPASYFLTVSWLDDADLDAETRQGTCGTSGVVRRPETADLRWQNPDDRLSESAFRPGLDVVLASVEVQRCCLAADVSAAERRNAMPEEIPYVYSGQTVAGATPWRLWPNDKQPLGVATAVSTAEAGFGGTPRYQAHVLGARIMLLGGGQFPMPVVVDGYAGISDPGSAGFELRVMLPAGGFVAAEDVAVPLNPADVVHASTFPGQLTSELAWHVVWLGVEG
jgi:hypothetical protein